MFIEKKPPEAGGFFYSVKSKYLILRLAAFFLHIGFIGLNC